MKNNQLKGIKIAMTIITTLTLIGVIVYLFPIIKNIATPEGQAEFKYIIQHSGMKGIGLLFGLEIAQIFLFILPGEPLEILAGMCYGEIGGTIFIVVSVAITTAIIFFLVRKYGRKFIYELCDQEKIEKLENSNYFKNPKNLEYTLIILFMMPGTPKDLLIYIGGLLPIKPKRFILIATLARIPSIISSTLAGASMMRAKWITMVLVYVIPLLIALVIIGAMKVIEKRKVKRRKSMKKQKVIEELERLCFYFFICALIGFILESFYALMLGNYEKRGFLYGPICPIYGFGALILIVLDDFISKKNNSIMVKMIVMAIVFTIFEYLVSLIFELIFGIRWWDYSNAFMNLQGRICLEFSILWGIGGGAFIQFLYKPLQRLIDKVKNRIPPITIRIALLLLSGITLADFIFSIVKYLK